MLEIEKRYSVKIESLCFSPLKITCTRENVLLAGSSRRQKRDSILYSYKKRKFLFITHDADRESSAQPLYYKIDLQGCACTVR